MGVRPPINPERAAAINERLERQIARIYLLWLLGIVVGAVHLRVQKIGELSFSIDDPDVVQGLIFVGCVIYYVGFFATAIIGNFELVFTTVHQKRRIIYAALGTRRSLVGRDKLGIRVVKASARVMLCFGTVFLFVYAFLPLGHILLFGQVALLKGIDAIFGTHSVENNQVLLYSVPAMIGAGLALLAWTLLISRARWSRISGNRIAKAFEVNVVAAVTFAAADWLFRGQEDWSHTWKRIASLQLLIYAGYYVVITLRYIFIDFVPWLKIKILTARLKRLQKKQQEHT